MVGHEEIHDDVLKFNRLELLQEIADVERKRIFEKEKVEETAEVQAA